MKFIARRQQRLAQLRHQRPQLADIFGFYEGLYAFLAPRTARVLSSPQGPAAPRTDQSYPLLQPANLQLDRAEALALLQGLTALLRLHGREGQADLERLALALETERLDPAALFGAYLERDRYPLVKTAEAIAVTPALLEYLLGLACSFALQQARELGLEPPARQSQRLDCPLCGSPPAMGELVGEEGRMVLHCGTCGQSWPAARRQCSCCGNRDEASLEYFTAGEEPGYRVNVCRQCGGYLKVVDSRLAGTDLPMDLEDLATLHLDLLAQREGFTKGKQAVEATAH